MNNIRMNSVWKTETHNTKQIKVLQETVTTVLIYRIETRTPAFKTIKNQVYTTSYEISNTRRKPNRQKKTGMIKTTIINRWYYDKNIKSKRYWQDIWRGCNNTEWKLWVDKRNPGRPLMKWYDEVGKLAGRTWMTIAQDRHIEEMEET